MSVIINASNTSGLVISNDMSGTLALQNNGVNNLTIDAGGKILLPNQPKFAAYHSLGSTATANALVPFNLKHFDIGNNYSTSTYLFTAPIAGYYQFNYTIRVDNYTSGNYFHFWPYVNGAAGHVYSGATIYTPSSSSYNYASSSWLMYLAANSTVGIYNASQITAGTYTSSQSAFSGFLVG